MVTLLQAYCITLTLDIGIVNMHYFYTSAFATLCFVLFAMGGKIEKCVCIKFCVRLGKCTNKTLTMLHETSGEHSLSHVRFEVFTAVTMKNGVFWVVTPCGSCKNRRFGGTWYFFAAYVSC
jgi:hypothetical protein